MNKLSAAAKALLGDRIALKTYSGFVISVEPNGVFEATPQSGNLEDSLTRGSRDKELSKLQATIDRACERRTAAPPRVKPSVACWVKVPQQKGPKALRGQVVRGTYKGVHLGNGYIMVRIGKKTELIERPTLYPANMPPEIVATLIEAQSALVRAERKLKAYEVETPYTYSYSRGGKTTLEQELADNLKTSDRA